MIKRKDKIVIAALELLEEKGIVGLTTKALAKKQGISEPALYRQFKSKHDIYVAMIDILASYDDQIMNTIVHNEMLVNDAVIYYMTRYAELYQSYSELTSILYSMDLYYYHEATKNQVKNILDKRNEFLTQVFLPAENQYKLSANKIALEINELLFTEVYRWRLNDKTYDLKKELLTRTVQLMKREAVDENTIS